MIGNEAQLYKLPWKEEHLTARSTREVFQTRPDPRAISAGLPRDSARVRTNRGRSDHGIMKMAKLFPDIIISLATSALEDLMTDAAGVDESGEMRLAYARDCQYEESRSSDRKWIFTA